MDSATDLGQAPEANVLNTLDFDKALVHILHWFRQEQHTFVRCFHHQPTIYEPFVTTLRGILTSVPPATPPATPHVDDQSTSSNEPRISKRRRLSSTSLDADLLPADVAGRVQDIAAFDDLVFFWERLQSYPLNPCLQTLSRRQRLEALWACISYNEKLERWTTILQRLCEVEFFGQYLSERTRYNQLKEQRRRDKSEHLRALEATPMPPHPLGEYVDLCIAKEMEENRTKAKKRFENLVRTKEPWVKLAQRFGKGIFVITCTALRDEHLRTLRKSHLELLLDHIEVSKPALSDHLKYLSEFLSYFIEHGRLPPYKLKLETLSRDQLESLRPTQWSLKELLDQGSSREAEHPVLNSIDLNRPTSEPPEKLDDLSNSSILSPASSVPSPPQFPHSPVLDNAFELDTTNYTMSPAETKPSSSPTHPSVPLTELGPSSNVCIDDNMNKLVDNGDYAIPANLNISPEISLYLKQDDHVVPSMLESAFLSSPIEETSLDALLDQL